MSRFKNLTSKPQPQSNNLLSLKHSIFDYLISLNIKEQTLPPTFILPCMLSYFAILSFGTLPKAYRDTAIDVNDQRLIFTVLMCAGVYAIVYVAVVVVCVRRGSAKESGKGMLGVSVYMTIAFTYIVYPLTTFIMASQIDLIAKGDHNRTSEGLLAEAIFIFLFGGFIVLFRLMTRNTTYCKSILASTFKGTEMTSYYAGLSSMILSTLKGSPEASLGKFIAIVVISNSFTLFALLFMIRTPVFWNRILNLIYISLYTVLICLKLTMAIEYKGFTLVIFITLLFMAAFAIKLISSFVHRSYEIDIFDEKTTPLRKCLGITVMLSLFESDTSHLSQADKSLRAFYTGIWQSGTQNDKPSKSTPKQAMRQKLVDILTKMAYNNSNALRLKLQLQITQLLPHLKTVNQTMARLNVLNGTYFFGEFDTYHHRRIVECKLEAIYKGKIKDDDPSEDIADAYSYLKWHMTPDTAEDGNKLDIATPFKASYHFKKIGILIENILKYQSNIYERMDQDGNTSSQIYYNLNIKTKNTKDSCERAINKLIIEHNIDDLVTYFYPNLIFFYALIRYEIKIADKLLYHYKKKLFKLGHLKALDANGKIDPDLLIEINSVTMRVSISEESMGKIKDISLNYYEYLGHEISGKEAIDSNISAMILPEFQELHANAMASLNSTEQLDRHQHMLVRDFDGYTREFSGKIKLMPSLQIELSSVVNLQTKEKKSSMVVLLDKNNAIVGGDQAFTIVIAQAGVDIEKDKVNFSKISSNICASINLLRVLATNTSQKKEVKNQKAGCSKRIFRCVNSEEEDRLLESLKNLKLSNDSDGLQYMIEDKSILCDIMTHPTMTATVNLIQVFGKDMVKVIIGKAPFRSILYENPQTMTMNSMNETKEKTNRDQISSSASREDHNQAFRSHNNFDRVAKDALTFDDGGLSSKKFDEMAVGLLKALDFTYKKQKEAESKRSILDLDSIMPAVASESLELIRQVAKEVALISVDENRVNSTDQAVISDMQPCLLLNLKSLILKGEKLPIDKKKIKMQMSSIINDTSQSEMQWKMSLKAFKSYVKDPQQSPLSPPSFLMPMTEERIPDMNDSEFMLSKFKTLKTVKQKRSHRPTAIKVHMAEDKDNNAKLINGKAGSKRMIRFDIPEADINDEKSPEGKRSPRKRLPTRFDKSDKKLAEMDENQDFGKKIGLASVSMKQKTTNGIAENDEKAQKIDEMDKIEKIDEMDEKLKHKEPTYVSTDKDNGIKERTLIEIARSLKSRLRLKTKIAVGLSAVVSQKIKVMNIRKTKEQNSLMNSRRETESQMAKKKINLATIDFIGQMISKVMVVYDNQSNEITIIR